MPEPSSFEQAELVSDLGRGIFPLSSVRDSSPRDSASHSWPHKISGRKSLASSQAQDFVTVPGQYPKMRTVTGPPARSRASGPPDSTFCPARIQSSSPITHAVTSGHPDSKYCAAQFQSSGPVTHTVTSDTSDPTSYPARCQSSGHITHTVTSDRPDPPSVPARFRPFGPFTHSVPSVHPDPASSPEVHPTRFRPSGSLSHGILFSEPPGKASFPDFFPVRSSRPEEGQIFSTQRMFLPDPSGSGFIPYTVRIAGLPATSSTRLRSPSPSVARESGARDSTAFISSPERLSSPESSPEKSCFSSRNLTPSHWDSLPEDTRRNLMLAFSRVHPFSTEAPTGGELVSATPSVSFRSSPPPSLCDEPQPSSSSQTFLEMFQQFSSDVKPSQEAQDMESLLPGFAPSSSKSSKLELHPPPFLDRTVKRFSDSFASSKGRHPRLPCIKSSLPLAKPFLPFQRQSVTSAMEQSFSLPARLKNVKCQATSQSLLDVQSHVSLATEASATSASLLAGLASMIGELEDPADPESYGFREQTTPSQVRETLYHLASSIERSISHSVASRFLLEKEMRKAAVSASPALHSLDSSDLLLAPPQPDSLFPPEKFQEAVAHQDSNRKRRLEEQVIQQLKKPRFSHRDSRQRRTQSSSSSRNPRRYDQFSRFRRNGPSATATSSSPKRAYKPRGGSSSRGRSQQKSKPFSR